MFLLVSLDFFFMFDFSNFCGGAIVVSEVGSHVAQPGPKVHL